MNLKKNFLNNIFLFLVILKLIECESEKIYNIVALGNTGVGKSSLLNMLAGDQQAFEVNNDVINFANLTKYAVYKAMNLSKFPSLRLVDTQGLSDGRGDERDYENIKEIVEKLRELKYVDLFLLCLDGPNPRLSHYLKTTIKLYKSIFDDFLEHTVIVFNKWTSADPSESQYREKQYQDMFKNDYQKANIPCFFIDSHFNLEKIRYNENGDPQKIFLNKRIQQKTLDQIESLFLFLETKKIRCDVSKAESKKPETLQIKDERDELKDRFTLYDEYGSSTVDRLLSTHRFLESSCSSDSDWYFDWGVKWRGSFGCSTYERSSSNGWASSYGAKEHAAIDFLKKYITNGRIKRKDIEKYLGLKKKDEL